MKKYFCLITGFLFLICLAIILFFLPTVIKFIELSQFNDYLYMYLFLFIMILILVCNLVLILIAFIDNLKTQISNKNQPIKIKIGIIYLISSGIALFQFFLWFSSTFQTIWYAHIYRFFREISTLTTITYWHAIITLVFLSLILSISYLRQIFEVSPDKAATRKQKKIDKLNRKIEKLKKD